MEAETRKACNNGKEPNKSVEQVQQMKGNNKRKQLNRLKLKNYKKTTNG